LINVQNSSGTIELSRSVAVNYRLTNHTTQQPVQKQKI